MCANRDDGCCGSCAAAGAVGAEPELMRRMVQALGLDGLLSAGERAEAAARCGDCADAPACADGLAAADLRGVERAPDYCVNKDRFDALASEAPATF